MGLCCNSTNQARVGTTQQLVVTSTTTKSKMASATAKADHSISSRQEKQSSAALDGHKLTDVEIVI